MTRIGKCNCKACTFYSYCLTNYGFGLRCRYNISNWPDAQSDYSNPVNLQLDFNNAQSLYLEAQKSADQAGLSRDDALARIALAKSKLIEHSKLLERYVSALQINCPADGQFKLAVAVKSFVKKGHTLAEIVI